MKLSIKDILWYPKLIPRIPKQIPKNPKDTIIIHNWCVIYLWIDTCQRLSVQVSFIWSKKYFLKSKLLFSNIFQIYLKNNNYLHKVLITRFYLTNKLKRKCEIFLKFTIYQMNRSRSKKKLNNWMLIKVLFLYNHF